MPVTIKDKSGLERSMIEANGRPGGPGLIVIDFFATWCGPCRQIAPIFDKLSESHQNVIFLRVDVDQSEELAAEYGVSSLPTFVFLRNGKLIDRVLGANASTLTNKLINHTKSDAPASSSSGAPSNSESKQPDLSPMIDFSQTECLNEDDGHPLSAILSADASPDAFLCSDTDAQLVMFVTFNQVVRLRSLQIAAPEDSGPRTIKLFVNQTATPDFSSCETADPVQLLELQPKDLIDDAIIQLNFVKFQKVTSLTLFVNDNQKETDVTQINRLRFFGSASNSTNMTNFKRVSGKAGEAHS